jgi:nucleoside-diphosphate-sugar epimerase
MRGMKTVLIVGFGDTGERVARLLKGRYRVVALIRKPDKARQARRLGLQVVRGDLDRPQSLESLAVFGRLDGLRICHFAPPPLSGLRDSRTRNLISALWPNGGRAKRAMLSRGQGQRLVYVSTSGVYGDCGGDWVDETRPLRPKTARAVRRVDAERTILKHTQLSGLRASVLRAPGIVSETRLPLDRLRRGTPALADEDDVWVNHIHAEDLARAAVAALARARRGRLFNCVDDAPTKMAAYFDQVSQRAGLPAPPRISREEALRTLPSVLYSFMNESRRLSNARLKRELKFALLFPSIETLLDKVFGKN